MRTKNEELQLSSLDLTANIDSSAVPLVNIVNYSIQVVYTGTPNGTLKLQGSNDKGSGDLQSQTTSVQNWTDLGISDSVSASGSSLFNVENCGYRWVRLVWTNSSSGGGSLISSARVNVKGI